MAANFAFDIDKFAQKVGLKIDTVLRTTLFDLSTAIVGRTPRDTGRLVGNWQFGEDFIPDTVVAAGSMNGAGDGVANATLSALKAQIRGVKVGHVHYLINNLPYAPVVEYGLYPDPPVQGSYVKGQGYVIKSQGGFSKQAPAGMVNVTVLEFQTYVNKALAAGTP